ncbi:2-dehydropantoate 2-reductase [Kribbia dieselivorans]|uniref:2-dehydropantoate 2-reductase n=1 Tax=Kribbia dieselivorans TaxID=331526 RepID=UPI0008390010|nr:2-dehydropantoate 2-reductase [Kribbia dieselivorans]
MVRRLRIAVVGAGHVGCHLGGRLSQVADVSLIGRPRVIDPIRRDGLTLTGGGRPPLHVAPAQVTATTEGSAVGGADLVLLTTKTTATGAAVREVAPHLPTDAVIVTFQNGLRNGTLINDALLEVFPSAASRPLVLEGMIPYNVAQTAATTFHQASAGVLVVRDHPRADPFLQAARDSGLAIQPRADMDGIIAAKLLLNLNNAVHALSGLSLIEELRDRDLRRVSALCIEEALAVFHRAGIRPSWLTGLPPKSIPSLLRSPTPVFASLARQVLQVDVHATTSMADDFARGVPTEIGELQGRIVDLGRAHGVPTPVCARIVDLVRSVEASPPPHERWSGARLLTAVSARMSA